MRCLVLLLPDMLFGVISLKIFWYVQTNIKKNKGTQAHISGLVKLHMKCLDRKLMIRVRTVRIGFD